MSEFGIRINAAGRHEVYQTDDEIRRTPIRDFAKPREAIAFAAMRDLRVSPLRELPGTRSGDRGLPGGGVGGRQIRSSDRKPVGASAPESPSPGLPATG